MTGLPAALLFDMDGTLTTTEDWWFDTEVEVFARYGIECTREMIKPIIGRSLPYSAAYLIKRYGIPLTPDALISTLLEGIEARAMREPSPWMPGIFDLLNLSVSLGIPSAVVTSSYSSFARLALKDAPDGALAVMVTGDEDIAPKPDPEPYRKAATRLGVDIEECLVFEDSLVGVRSGMAARARTIHVPYQVDFVSPPGLIRRESAEGIDEDELLEYMSMPVPEGDPFLDRGREGIAR